MLFLSDFLYGLQQSCINEVEFFTNEESTDPAVRFYVSYDIFFWVIRYLSYVHQELEINLLNLFNHGC